MTSMTKFKPATPDRLQKSSGAHSATAGPHIERRTEAPSDVDAASDLSAITLALVVVSLLFQTYAPDPYMDEPFHVPQTQRYCQGHFAEWDPKITTFPGLYVLGAAVGRAQHAVLNLVLPKSRLAQDLCGTAVLRAVNIGLGAACFSLSRALHRELHPTAGQEAATQTALMVTLMPTHFFYIFLYYTDPGSLACILAALLAALKRQKYVSGLAAASAVLFRQTNAVWTCLVILVAVLRRLSEANLSRLRRSSLLEQLIILLKLCWLNKLWLLSELWPLAIVPAAFGAFVVWNGGIVVGDRASHAPAPHFVQPLYCCLFTAAVLAQVHFSPSRLSDAFSRATQKFRRSPTAALKPVGMGFVCATYIVHNYTLAHPYLLADNRHYTFYLWKDVISPYPAAKYCLVPLYMYSAWSIADTLNSGGQMGVWTAGLAFCSAVTLTPALLLEFRYFTIPVVLVVLHMKPVARQERLLTLALFAVANALTIYMFLFRPFKWVDGSVARFMW